jgi:hypothetical protein
LNSIGVGSSQDFIVGVTGIFGTQQSVRSARTVPPTKKSIFDGLIGSPLTGGIGDFILSVFVGWPRLGTICFDAFSAFGCDIACGTCPWNEFVWPQLMNEWRHSYVCLRGYRFLL